MEEYYGSTGSKAACMSRGLRILRQADELKMSKDLRSIPPDGRLDMMDEGTAMVDYSSKSQR